MAINVVTKSEFNIAITCKKLESWLLSNYYIAVVVVAQYRSTLT